VELRASINGTHVVVAVARKPILPGPCRIQAVEGCMDFVLRAATLADVPALEWLITASTRGLSRADYTDEQIEAALGSAMGVDSELIRDGTYFVVEAEGQLVGCGGWSRRRTLFGADAGTGRESALLDPSHEAARIRAFFVHPDWARRGIGRLLLDHCEAAARAHGFTAAELMATLPGQRLYRVCGYVAGVPIQHPLGDGLTIEFVPMRKSFA
jgi:GNAT superfamily N-acetyltransferase